MDDAEPQGLLFAVDEPSRSSTEEEAMDLIQPLLPELSHAMFSAFKALRTDILPATLDMLSPSVRGQAVTCLVWEHVRNRLTGMQGITFCSRLSFFKVVVRDRIAIRFKRLDKNLLAASEPTDQAIAWFGNASLDGISPHWLRVNFGYRPSSDWLQCTQYYVTH